MKFECNWVSVFLFGGLATPGWGVRASPAPASQELPEQPPSHDGSSSEWLQQEAPWVREAEQGKQLMLAGLKKKDELGP